MDEKTKEFLKPNRKKKLIFTMLAIFFTYVLLLPEVKNLLNFIPPNHPINPGNYDNHPPSFYSTCPST